MFTQMRIAFDYNRGQTFPKSKQFLCVISIKYKFRQKKCLCEVLDIAEQMVFHLWMKTTERFEKKKIFQRKIYNN